MSKLECLMSQDHQQPHQPYTVTTVSGGFLRKRGGGARDSATGAGALQSAAKP